MLRPLPVSLASWTLLLLLGAPQPARAQALDPDRFAGMAARSIGPAGMSGRVTAVEGVPGRPELIYVGAASGGLWKSEDGGVTFRPLFDEQPVHSIGSVAVHPRFPERVWVGTGEGNLRNSVSVGNGVYRSVDGGEHFEHRGLEGTERIPRIVLHPADPDVAYVAALGPAWGDGEERGVYKTVDGGATWRKVLAGNSSTGAADLVMDPTDPDKLFAALWDFRRRADTFRSGGPGSGLFVTRDGGEHWTRLTEEDGVPPGDLGRIGLAIAPSDPDVVYALVEAEDAALLRSDDGGRSFETISTDENRGDRPFYYSQLRVDPEWPHRVYSLWSLVSVSNDGGRTFEVLVPFAEVHPDHHTMWIDPANPRRILDGNDGGVAVSHDRGSTWRFIHNLPLAQFYHVDVDGERPYHVYGGMQDNGSWRGPSSVWENGGIRNHHWEEVGFGDGFRCLPDPEDARTGYSMSQEGYLMRWDLRTGERRLIRPPEPEGIPLRFNWNTPLAIDPFDSRTIYYGSQFVHRSHDRGNTWEIVSPDLTTNNPEWQKQAESGGLTPDVTGAENHTTLVVLEPSPVESGVLWAGSDDGRVSVTLDGCQSWISVEEQISGAPANAWVAHIEPSKFDPSAAFVVLDAHRSSDFATYVYRTTDLGSSWESLVTPELRGYALSLEQDPVREDLLFLGTEFGLFVTLDGGRHWFPWKHGLPTASVMDLVIPPSAPDLVIGTHGRAAFVLDDLTPLRHATAEVLEAPLFLFPVEPAQQYVVKQTGASRFPGHGEFRGENRPYGALLTFGLNAEDLPLPDEEKERARKQAARAAAAGEPGSLEESGAVKESVAAAEEPEEAEKKEEAKKKDEGPKVTVEIHDSTGARIRKFEEPVHQGINRLAWNLRRDGPQPLPGDEDEEEGEDFTPEGPEVLPGQYRVTLRFREQEASEDLAVLADPRLEIPEADRAERLRAQLRAGELQDVLARALERILEVREQVSWVEKLAAAAMPDEEDSTGAEAGGEGEENGPYAALLEDGKKLRATLEALEKKLRTPPGTEGIPAEDHAWSHVSRAQWFLESALDAPSPAQLAYLTRAEAEVAAAMQEVNRVFAEDVARYRTALQQSGLVLLPGYAPLEVP